MNFKKLTIHEGNFIKSFTYSYSSLTNKKFKNTVQTNEKNEKQSRMRDRHVFWPREANFFGNSSPTK